ncbi:MAG: DUF1385 domain-containing protein [Candidatus Bathyarchaeota archaeon]|nr:DUF1385 domain-containing protein [Candidatus Bathyarchaeota archaeon]
MASKKEEQSLAFGGQALIEGVMMRSGSHMVLCVRQPDDGISTHSQEISSLVRRNRVLGLPFIRGIILLFETMYYGVKGIFHSANIAMEEEDEEFTWKEYLLVIVGVTVMSGFFMVVPFLLATYLGLTGFLLNVAESAVRLTLFVLYLYIVSRWDEFRRVLQYHGAEHKAINAHEAGASMDTETVAGFSRLNPRCGTSFLFIVVIISIILFSVLPRSTFAMRIAYRIVLIPVLGAISYEILKLSAKYSDSPIMKLVIVPGLAMQRLTTQEPEPDMIEVAVRALEEVKRLNELEASGEADSA